MLKRIIPSANDSISFSTFIYDASNQLTAVFDNGLVLYFITGSDLSLSKHTRAQISYGNWGYTGYTGYTGAYAYEYNLQGLVSTIVL